jgi:regulatory protein
MYSKNTLTPGQAFEKIKQYCAYQERCHYEVKEKLYGYGLRKYEVEELLSKLIENNHLNEERFATLFAGGKFRIKKWGRKKIAYELQQKRVSSYCIKIGLQEIPMDDYLATATQLATKKWQSLEKENNYARQAKTAQYMYQKGYESSITKEILKTLQ